MPGQQPLVHDPMKFMFDRLLEDDLFQDGPIDDSSAITSQGTPRIDIEEDDKAFVLREDVPGVEL